MLKLTFGAKQTNVCRVLCLGAHCDDIEIGCGGTILRLLEENQRLEFCWIVFSSTPQRRQEAKKAAKMFLKSAQKAQIVMKDFRDSFFPFQGENIKKFFEALKKRFLPDLIFTHYRDDLHQDHRLISDLTWNTFRDHLILEYEIPKYDGDLGAPNFFVTLSEPHCRRKIQNLLDAFGSQRDKQWFTEETFRALLRIRGIECNAPGKYAEAFHCRKMSLADWKSQQL
jgi:LmbE family N-acetylglucosaminyl deacetylase